MARPPQPVEGNYVTLSETSDEMYAAIEDNVYTHPAGAEEESNDMYSKVDKAKKRAKSTGAEEKPAYATVSKPSNNGSDGRFNLGSQGGELGARPKQRSPCPPSGEAVDYSEYEVAHTDSTRASRFYGQSRDPGYETVPYSDLGQEREPGYEVMPQVQYRSLSIRRITDVNRFGATWEDSETLSMKLLPLRRVIQDTKVSIKGNGSTPLILVMRCLYPIK